MKISGSIGITILKKKNKIIILLADDHSNSNYCDNEGFKNHQSIKEYLESELDEGNQILLEEVPRDGFLLEELWPDSPHTQSLKNFFLEENNITGIDIRPYLLPFSVDVIDSKEILKDVKMIEYIKQLDDFFNLKGKYFNSVFRPVLDELIIKNSGLGKNLRFITEHFKKIKNKIMNENKNIGYYYDNDKDILDDISILCDEIMEFGTLLKAFTSNNKSIIHAGLFHSHNMLKWLTGDYDFEIIYENGLNNYDQILDKEYKSCIRLPELKTFGFKD